MNTFRIFNTAVRIFTMCMLIFAAVSLSADTPKEIRTKMKERLETLDKLKDAGVIGENNMGYVTVRDDSAETKKIETDENADRKIVYTALAKKLGTTPELVGQRRAIKIAELGKPDQWFQNAKGEWYQKK